MTVLDTSVVSHLFARGGSRRFPGLFDFVRRTEGGSGLAISFITLFELRRGFEVLALRGHGRRKRVLLEKVPRISRGSGIG